MSRPSGSTGQSIPGPDPLVMRFVYPADSGHGLRIHRAFERHEGPDRRRWRGLADGSDPPGAPARPRISPRSTRRWPECPHHGRPRHDPRRTPTFWFIGVTTAQSSIMRGVSGLGPAPGTGDVAMRGIDLALHDLPDATARSCDSSRPTRCRAAACHEPQADLFAAAHDLFDEIDPHAGDGRTSCLSKRAGRLICHAKDPISSGLALDGLPAARPFRPQGPSCSRWEPAARPSR